MKNFKGTFHVPIWEKKFHVQIENTFCNFQQEKAPKHAIKKLKKPFHLSRTDADKTDDASVEIEVWLFIAAKTYHLSLKQLMTKIPPFLSQSHI